MTRLKAFFLNLFSINPIIVKEIRSRMRGPRAFITLTVMLLTMGGIMYAMLQLLLVNSRYINMLSPQIGQALFAALAFLELAMICAVTPAVTAGALSGEKERQTYEMLMATPLSATSILWGKLVSALSYVLLLLFAGIPLASVIFIFGGVAPREMLKALVVLFGVAIAFGILGLFMSALFGRTGRATVATFITVVLLMLGPIFIAVLIGVLRGGEPPRWVLAPSPISALSAALASSMGADAGGGVFNVLGGIFGTGVNSVSQTSIPRPLYHYTLPFYTILSVVLYLLTTRLVQPTRRWRLKRKEVIITTLALLLVIGAFVGGYFATAQRYEWVVLPPTPTPALFPAQAFPAVAVEKQIFAQTATPLPPPTTAVDPQATPPASSTPQGPGPTPEPTRSAATPAASTPVGTTPVAATPVSFETMNMEEQAEIYAAVARQLYSVDHTFGNNPPNWPGLYLISMTQDGIADPNEPKGDPVVFPKDMLNIIAKGLNDLPAKVMWVDGESKVAKDPQNGTLDGGNSAMITFSNLYLQPDGTLHVSARLYFGALGATGKTYILEKVDGAWKVTGATGVQWIS